MSSFQNNLWRAIKNQITQKEESEDSWSVINRRHQNDDIVAPGTRLNDIKTKGLIKLRIYFDCSGSFEEADINRVKEVLGALKPFEATLTATGVPKAEGKKRLVTQLIYFANHLHNNFSSARAEGGTGAWPEIIEDLQQAQPENVVIITDQDMQSTCNWLGKTYKAKGCVWYIWKGTKAPSLPDHVQGRKGTLQYSL